ncbi:hypothetical protein [Williamwhitmania taraxaci]|nr:hypothetical protein [Williamwhitmania taraxaci]
MSSKQRENLIYLTAILIAVSGLFHLVDTLTGKVLFDLAFGPYLYVQTRHFWKMKKLGVAIEGVESRRYYILIALWICLLFTLINFLSVPFLMIFLVMVDYLVVSQTE